MRKLFAFLMIALISLQAAFAAAGSACLHERDAGTRHFGHHAHEHRLTVSDPVSDPASDPDAAQAPADSGAPDHDCTNCHANALSGVPARSLLPALPASLTVTVDASPFHPPSPPPWRPERPNWGRMHAA